MTKTPFVPEDRIEKLWYFAQLESGLESSNIDREPMVGSANVIEQMSKEYDINGAFSPTFAGNSGPDAMSLKVDGKMFVFIGELATKLGK